MHPFGTKCIYYESEGKLQARRKDGVLVGLSEDIDEFRLWIPGTTGVKRIKDVVFPKGTLFESAKKIPTSSKEDGDKQNANESTTGRQSAIPEEEEEPAQEQRDVVPSSSRETDDDTNQPIT